MIREGRIVAVGAAPDGVPVEELGDVAIIPGLVNAHTHLEFSDLSEPIGRPGMGMVNWLRAVIEYRAAQESDTASAVAQGLAESSRSGVTTIGEIAQAGFADEAYGNLHCEGVRFLELIAPTRDRVEAVVEKARTYLERTHLAPRDVGLPHLAERDEYAGWQPGLSPHAPYTVHPELLARSVELSNEFRIPLAMHLAESREEIEFLRDQAGPFRDLLEARGAWDAAARPRGSRPLDELRVLSRARRALVIHGNYLDDEEIDFVAAHRHTMAIVYCPRTHAWFGHASYPLEKLLAAGVVVAMGTDSRASSPDLNLLSEMRHVARAFPGLSRATILELGTLAGARALGLDAEIGTLEPGKLAHLAAIRLPDDPRDDPHELLLDGDGEALPITLP